MFRSAVVSCLLFSPLIASAAEIPVWERPPGWADTKGGEGGKVIEVTTLEAKGPGSLAEALGAKGPRTIVFKVGGVIDLAGGRLKIANPNVTIAGETAPSPGITVIKGGLAISADDVIIRHIRVRPGEAGKAKKSGWECDAIATNGAANVIVDHCSVSWATDENLTASGPRFEGATPDEWRENTSHKITFSHCIIGEGLKNSTHKKGVHSMGSLVHDNTSEVLIYGNLYISNNDRNPFFKGGARGAVVNNLIHNPGSHGLTFAMSKKEWEGHEPQRGIVAAAGNVLRQGASSKPRGFSRWRGPSDVWLSDNPVFDKEGKAMPPQTDFVDENGKSSTAEAQGVVMMDKAPVWPEGLVAKPSGQTKDWVLENAGARPWDRDATDKRLLSEAANGGGRIIDGESEVGGY